MKQEETKQGNQQKQEYEQYVKSVTPTHNLWAQMGKAFLTGGIICCICLLYTSPSPRDTR